MDNVRYGSFALSLCSVKLLAGNVGAEHQAGLYGQELGLLYSFWAYPGWARLPSFC